jgi:hypothetical protein|tara:strand:- start:1049 stop:1309 length:261 start_codon:yes stop_codon:yes gene_type:complete
MTGKQVEGYIKYNLQMTPRHDVHALADAVTDMAQELDYDEFALLQLLIENKPIDDLHTHSYGFHTSNGRSIIETIKEKYYEYESAS